MKKILIVFGTRPEAIKMAPIVKVLGGYRKDYDVKICVTAQHREMLDQVLELFKISPDFDMNLMEMQQSLSGITAKVLLGLENIFTKFKPNLILIHGDTTTTLATALAAYYHKIDIGHVEAGLRTGDIYSPWPEEVNRTVVSAMAKLNFAPTESSKRNLLKEGVSIKNIFVTGNTVIDALLQTRDSIFNDVEMKKNLAKRFDFLNPDKKIILVTAHRRENFGEGLKNIFKALVTLSHRDDVQIICPVHLNPNVQSAANEMLKNKKNIHLIDPQSYAPFVYLMEKCYLLLTDSGGVQEEAPSLGKPVLVLRNTTERPEAIQAGTVKLVGTDYDKIVDTTIELLDNNEEYLKFSKIANPYGDGKSAQRICDLVVNYLSY
jgi:UDP-N-acetylglucosamine 2-epimerase (non-hydrolysing)